MDDHRASGPSRNGQSADVPLPRTDRPDAPAYLRSYLDRRAREARDQLLPGDLSDTGDQEAADDPTVPLYLRRFRARRAHGAPSVPFAAPIPGDEQPTWTEAWAITSRSNELIAPPEIRPEPTGPEGVVDVHLVRHGETQGYSVSAGLTAMGRWQAHRRGHDLSKMLRDGELLRLVCAPTARATQTAEQIRRGVADGLLMWGRTAEIEGPEPMDEFLNFRVRTPTGEKDITSAFREYHALSERYDRIALGDRPLWLVEIDRFYRIQLGGGDPIHFWMTVPLLNFEPATAVVVRFWAGITRLVAEAPVGTRIVVATHSGPLRAFATWALGHDAGEPYNVEEVRVKVRRSLTEAQVTYRSRTADVQIPPVSDRPTWWGEQAAAVAAGVGVD